MNSRERDLHLLTGAYAADAVAGPELTAFEKHLERCVSCAEEVKALRETAARLGMATATAPPPGMRQQVLAAAGLTRQLPPYGRRLPALSAVPQGAVPRGTRLRRALRRPAPAGSPTAPTSGGSRSDWHAWVP